MKINRQSPERSVLAELGQRLARVRKQHGLSQVRLAEQAGIGVATLRRIEGGQDSQLETWIKLLKSLGMASALDTLLPETFESPMQEALAERKSGKPKRVDRAIQWGDEQ